MRLIVAGSRNITSYKFVEEAIKSITPSIIGKVSYVISGKARGVDYLGECWAKQNNIQILEFPAEWNKFGKAAGPKRNEKMVENADILLACWDFKSLGTKHIISYAYKMNKPVYVRYYET